VAVVAERRSPLTPLSFRRDVRLFLAVLVGFLVVLLAAVLLLMQSFEADAEDAIRTNWNRAADFIAAEIPDTPADASVMQVRLDVLRAKYDIDAITLTPPKARPITSTTVDLHGPHENLRRTTHAGYVDMSFSAAEIHAMRRTFAITAVITLTAALIGATLLVLFIPTITRPIETMLESAAEIRGRDQHVDEREYLIETFRESISRLRSQEAELQRLHEIEKTRADDLERVTAALARSITSGLVTLDPAGRIVDLNAAAREILAPAQEVCTGLTPEEVFGTNPFSAALSGAVREQRAITRAEVTVGDADTAKVVGLTVVPLIGVEHQFLGTLALFTDLTPVRILESRLREVQTLADLGEIAAGIAHEFRNSLAAVLGYLRLARRAATPADADRAIANAEREAKLLSAAVDALLGFARPMTPDLQRVDLLELAQDVVARIKEEGATVPIEVRGESAPADGDPALLTRALENLVRNAVDSVRQRGEGGVRVAVANAHGAEVRVEDDGIGVDPADVPRLFLPFQTNRADGYGIGLPLAKKIVMLHNGTIQLTGKPNAGAVATVRLPPAEATDAKGNSFAHADNTGPGRLAR
jgi:signal transduction histidine kinase